MKTFVVRYDTPRKPEWQRLLRISGEHLSHHLPTKNVSLEMTLRGDYTCDNPPSKNPLPLAGLAEQSWGRGQPPGSAPLKPVATESDRTPDLHDLGRCSLNLYLSRIPIPGRLSGNVGVRGVKEVFHLLKWPSHQGRGAQWCNRAWEDVRGGNGEEGRSGAVCWKQTKTFSSTPGLISLLRQD